MAALMGLSLMATVARVANGWPRPRVVGPLTVKGAEIATLRGPHCAGFARAVLWLVLAKCGLRNLGQGGSRRAHVAQLILVHAGRRQRQGLELRL